MVETKCPKCGHEFETDPEIPFGELHSSQESYEKHRIMASREQQRKNPKNLYPSKKNLII